MKQRIVNLIGKSSVQNLLPIISETSVVKISGFTGKPENARKTAGEQFFFVNGRFMRSPYMYKAVMKAYEKLLQPATYPSFFIYFDLDPGMIDINIHPTKTEIKFAEEKTIWQILHATIRESLGKFSVVPSIEFDQANPIEISTLSKNEAAKSPEIKVNNTYNPFEQSTSFKSFNKEISFAQQENPDNWESLFETKNNGESLNTETKSTDSESGQIQIDSLKNEGRFFQFKNRYILTPVKSGLMIIDQKRAHERILFERFLYSINSQKKASQTTLFPKTLSFNVTDFEIIIQMLPDLDLLGFEIVTDKNNTIIVKAIPGDLNINDVNETIELLIEEYKNSDIDVKEKLAENICSNLATNASVKYGQALSNTEISNLFDLLFACKTPYYSPSGKRVLTILGNDEIDKKF